MLYYIIISIILAKQVVPVHPSTHPKHVPFRMWQTLFLQLPGHRSEQLIPYTPKAWQPETTRLFFGLLMIIATLFYLFILPYYVHVFAWMHFILFIKTNDLLMFFLSSDAFMLTFINKVRTRKTEFKIIFQTLWSSVRQIWSTIKKKWYTLKINYKVTFTQDNKFT